MNKANPINVTRIDHVVLRVADLERMIAFYRDVLGCRLERGPGNSGLAQLRAGDSLIDLLDINGTLDAHDNNTPARHAPNVDHVCLLINPWETDAVLKHLHAHGVEPGEVASRYGSTGQGPSIYFRDPEGNSIELKGSGA